MSPFMRQRVTDGQSAWFSLSERFLSFVRSRAVLAGTHSTRAGAPSSCLRTPFVMAMWTFGVMFADDARAGVFVQPTPDGAAPCGTNWSYIATGQFLPIRTSTVGSNGLPGAVVYWNTNSGLLQFDPHGHAITTLIITHTKGTVNVSATSPGPFYFPDGQYTVNAYSSATGVEGQRTFPAVVAVSGLQPTTFASRLAITIGAPLGPSLTTTGDAGNIASTTGYWDQPWAFPTNVLTPGLSSTNPAYTSFWASNSTLSITNFKVIGQTTHSNINLLGYGSGQGIFQYTANGIVGTQVGPVIPFDASSMVVLYDFYLHQQGERFSVCWKTASEEDTVGFDVFRWDGTAWAKLNDSLIKAQGEMGGTYGVEDPLANSTETFRYKLVEYETDGGVQVYGPFDVAASNPRMETVTITPEGVRLRWFSRAGETYEVQKSTDIGNGYEVIASGLPATLPVNDWTDPSISMKAAYYRVRVE